jgi:riboflavin kinase/FMN adenylyltransferase
VTGCRASQISGALLEAHIFDFVGDIYGRWIEVQMLSYLRPELNFDSLDLMVVQMGKDEIEAKRRLKAS